MLTTVWTVMLAMVALAGVAALALRSSAFGILTIMVLAVAAHLGATGPVGHIGSVNLFAGDVASVGMVLAALAGLARRRSATASEIGLLVLLALFAQSLLRGFAAYGMEGAGNEAREVFYLLAGALYFASPKRARRAASLFGRAWPALATMFVAIGVVNLIAVYRGITLLPRAVDVRGFVGVLNSSATLVVGQALVVLFVAARARSARARAAQDVLTGLLLFTVVLMQQRTAWVATALAVAVAAMLQPTMLWRFLRGAAVAAVLFWGVSASGLLAWPSSGGTAGSGSALSGSAAPAGAADVAAAVAQSAQKSGTFTWRILGWKALLADHEWTPVEVALGEPFGAGFHRSFYAKGREWVTDVGPHSLYVRTFLRLGLIGFVLALGLVVRAIALLAVRSDGEVSTSRLFVPLGITLAVFSMTYWLQVEQSLVLGLLLGMAEYGRRGGY